MIVMIVGNLFTRLKLGERKISPRSRDMCDVLHICTGTTI